MCHEMSCLRVVAQHVPGTSSCHTAEDHAIQKRIAHLPRLLNSHRFPDRHAAVGDWSDDCDMIGSSSKKLARIQALDDPINMSNHMRITSKTPEGRSATLRVQGLVFFFHF